MTARPKHPQTTRAEYQDCDFNQVCTSLVAKPAATEPRTAHTATSTIKTAVKYCLCTRKMHYYLRLFGGMEGQVVSAEHVAVESQGPGAPPA